MTDVHKIESDDRNIAGWYVSYSPDQDWESLTWIDRGSGPEVTSEDVWGPFDSWEEVEAWINKDREV